MRHQRRPSRRLLRQCRIAWSAPSNYLNQYWNFVNLTLRNKIQWNVNCNSHISVQENAFENVILSRPQCVNLSPLGAAYMCQWIEWALLVQITACRQFDTKPLFKPMLVNCTLRNILQWNFNQNKNFFNNENASENIVYERAIILSSEDELTLKPERSHDAICCHWEHRNLWLSLPWWQFYRR